MELCINRSRLAASEIPERPGGLSPQVDWEGREGRASEHGHHGVESATDKNMVTQSGTVASDVPKAPDLG
jgi:hypothetical protein